MLENTSSRPRIVWADVVRLAAIFMVICCHSAPPPLTYRLKPA